ncbi:hypothetical protein M0R89_10175 [Halorussus limi]|uniref:Uncharacterized protein n=1 Tax=Halorussus limi TaxID=2938695 RepID=A0A8U0HPE5_9EURY|nr:hypothetical protein [Halorussus limi]UPV72915.1 hypothetical protein M0R89_10175 [Halorussus limi]
MSDDGGHPILTVVGVVAVAVGLLMMFVPGFAAAIGTGYAAVTIVGLLALVQALRVGRARMATELRAAETADVETVEAMPTPGDEFDRTVAELRSGPRRVLIRERADLRDALENAAVTAVADRENCSREQARERVETGAWTDDPHAAAFLGGADAPSPPLFDRVKIAASTESPFQYRIRRTADAVARTAGVEPGDVSGGAGDDAGAAANGSEPDDGEPRADGRPGGGTDAGATDAAGTNGRAGGDAARGASDERASADPTDDAEQAVGERADESDRTEAGA